MRGNRRLVLREPAPTGERSGLGESREGPYIEHVVWAVREPFTGSGDIEGLVAGGVLGVDGRRVYRFPEDAIPRSRTVNGEVMRIALNEDWKAVDEAGVELNIEAVGEATTGPRRRWLRVVCARQTSTRVAQ